MWVKSKNLWAGWLALSLLLVLQLPIYSDDVTLTESEYNAVMTALTGAENELRKAQDEIERLKNLLEKQQKILDLQLTMWPMLKKSWNEQKSALKNEYWRGFRDGSLIGLAVGVGAGGYGGFSLGIRVRIPTGF